jgi:4-hydroxy-tetrahydrodipicolinate synthase
MKQELSGVFNVISTPLLDNDQIDHSTLAGEIEWLLRCGSNGLVLAMVSEVLRFSAQERREQWQSVIKSVAGRIPVVTSVGSESTAISCGLAKAAQEDGAFALMATPPSAFAATDEEILKYYVALIEAVEIPVIIQDASNYLGKPLDIGMYVQLLDTYGNTRVQFKPEAKPVVDRLKLLNEASGNRARVFEGQGGIDLLGTFPLDVVGSMPGAEVPWALVELWKSLVSGDTARAGEIHAPLAKLVSFQTTLDGYVAVEKYLLVKQGVFTSARQRGPVGFAISKELQKEIDQAFSELTTVVAPIAFN